MARTRKRGGDASKRLTKQMAQRFLPTSKCDLFAFSPCLFYLNNTCVDEEAFFEAFETGSYPDSFALVLHNPKEGITVESYSGEKVPNSNVYDGWLQQFAYCNETEWTMVDEKRISLLQEEVVDYFTVPGYQSDAMECSELESRIWFNEDCVMKSEFMKRLHQGMFPTFFEEYAKETDGTSIYVAGNWNEETGTYDISYRHKGLLKRYTMTVEELLGLFDLEIMDEADKTSFLPSYVRKRGGARRKTRRRRSRPLRFL
jgi:hypothetical protein